MTRGLNPVPQDRLREFLNLEAGKLGFVLKRPGNVAKFLSEKSICCTAELTHAVGPPDTCSFYKSLRIFSPYFKILHDL